MKILPRIRRDRALARARRAYSSPCSRARQAVERTPLTGETLQPVGPVTISIGVAPFPDHGRDFTDLIDLADRAMYASKEAGRNRVTLAGHDLTELTAA